MRKQTKVVAVASAAALLAIGGAMTSFAAQGWVEEDGTWYFYDKDGNRVEDQWKKSGDNWFWLDGEDGGAMATDKLIDDDGDTYYVDGNGVMVTNTWVRLLTRIRMMMMIRLSTTTTTCRRVVKLTRLAITAPAPSSAPSMARNMLSMRMVRCCMAG